MEKNFHVICLYPTQDLVYFCHNTHAVRRNSGSDSDSNFIAMSSSSSSSSSSRPQYMIELVSASDTQVAKEELVQELKTIVINPNEELMCFIIIEQKDENNDDLKNESIAALKSAYNREIKPEFVLVTDKIEDKKDTFNNQISKDEIFYNLPGQPTNSSDANAVIKYVIKITHPFADKFDRYIQIDKKRKQFEDLIGKLIKKQIDLYNRGFSEAAETIRSTITLLLSPANEYFDNPDKLSYDRFKQNAHDDIKNAIDKLDHHRDARWILANIALAILGLGVFYGIAVAYNGGLFFRTQKTVQLLNECNAEVESDKFSVPLTA